MASIQDRWVVDDPVTGQRVHSSRYGVGLRYRALYRTPDGQSRSKSFDRKVDATRFLTTVESSKLTGAYVDPAMSRLLVGEWSARWLEGQAHLQPSTLERYAGILRAHVDPKWGHVRLADVSHVDVQRWITKLFQTQSPASARKIHRVLSLVLALAVKDGRLHRNPAADINLPRPSRSEQRYLTHEQVALLAEACARRADPSRHGRPDELENPTARLIVLFLAYTGVRFGEMAALRVARLDLARRRATIAASVTPVHGRGMVWGLPKGHER